MLGLALGRIGLSYNDFCGLSLEEFGEVVKAYSEGQEDTTRGDWERMRMLAAITIQPHTKTKITPKKLLPLPWDKIHRLPAKRTAEDIARQRDRMDEIKKRQEKWRAQQ